MISKQLSSTTLIFLLSIACYSQIRFEKGYFINNSDEKVECLIKDNDWDNNPSKFTYQLTANSDHKVASIQSVKEFRIYNTPTQFIRKEVDIDRSSNKIDELSFEKNPSFTKEVLFLKVLVEGKASLYEYKDGNLIKFFYQVDNQPVAQLIYKQYKKDQTSIAENNRFRQQLWSDLKSPTLTPERAKKLQYKKKELLKLFIYHNELNGEKPIVHQKEREKKDFLSIGLRPGISHSSLNISNDVFASTNIDFGSKYNFRFGLEVELILPFNKNKWAVTIEPTYRNFKSTASFRRNDLVEIEYQSIEIPIGLRHYFFLGEDTKIFLNAAILLDFISNASNISINSNEYLEMNSQQNLAFGVGVNYKSRFSLELRHHTSRNITSIYRYNKSDFRTTSVIFGVTLF